MLQLLNDPKCQELGWVCVPLAVETYGNWGREAHTTFTHLATRLVICASLLSFSSHISLGFPAQMGAEKIAHGLRACIEHHWRDKGFSVLKLDIEECVQCCVTSGLLV